MSRRPRPAAGRVVGAVAIVPVGAALGLAVADVPADPSPLAGLVDRATPASGVAHDVTAVLLNFRALDTLLEVVVIVLALLGAFAAAGRLVLPARGAGLARDPVARTAVTLVVPAMVLVAGYVLWRGSTGPGGAFQAGALLAAAAVLAAVGGHAPRAVWPDLTSRAVVAIGLLAFVLAALEGLVVRGAVLRYPPDLAGTVIVLVEIGVALTVAAVLWLLFAAVAGVGEDRERTS